MRRLAPLFALLALAACDAPFDPAPPDDPAAWLVAHADAYLTDRAQRRAWLEGSLWQPALPYARKRLDSYALPRGGWDLLPEMPAAAAPLAADGSARAIETLPLDPPTTLAGWRALGERVFHRLPMRRDAYVEWLTTRPALWARAGLETNDDGDLIGLVRYTDARGDTHVGVTCALCHAGDGIDGRAARDLDLGWARARHLEATGRPGDLYETWGPGRVDVTADAIDDPIAIADLWSLPWQTHLNTSGVVALETPAALAIRFETQFITGHAFGERPPRVLVWALSIYMLTLDRPAATVDAAHPGAAIFAARCGGCHDPARGFGGGLVAPDGMIGDATPTRSPMRGTGYFKVPGLVGVGDGGPYLHDGRFATLEDLIAAGHPHGAPPAPDEIDRLLDYLHQL